MIAVIFEFTPVPGRFPDYMELVKGRASILASYRLRIAGVIRDYTMDERAQAPADSVAVHG